MFKKFPTLGRSCRIEITPRGLQVESEDAKGEYKWPLFYEIEESDKNFLLKQTLHRCDLSPKALISIRPKSPGSGRCFAHDIAGHLKLRSQ